MVQDQITKSAAQMGYDGTVVVSIDVSDLHKSIQWYQDVLGLELSYVMDEIGWCEMKTTTPKLTLGLSQREEVRVGDTTPTFGVSNIERARTHLEAHTVRFEGPTQTVAGMVKLATFYDPDGNPFMLAQTLTQQ